jgi:hypothetical protein
MAIFVSTQVGASIPFDNTGTDLEAETLQEAIVELSTGSTSGGVSFSWDYIQSSDTLNVPVRREMLLSGELCIEGILEIQGKVSIL